MPDMKLTIGAEASQVDQTLAKVKASFKSTGESLGLEFDRGAARAERRVERGMKEIIKSLSSAKDPIEAISGLVEGMGRAFQIASGAFLAIGIGAAVYEQITQAYEASEKLQKSLDKALSVNPDFESIHELQRDVQEFQKTAEEYANRGILEKILFGAEETEKFKSANALNDVKRNLIEIEEIEKQITRSKAAILTSSPDEKDKDEGRRMLAGIAADDSLKQMQGNLQAATDELKSNQDQMAALESDYARKRAYNQKYNQTDLQARDEAAYVQQREALQKSIDSGIATQKKYFEDIAAAKTSSAAVEANEDAEANSRERTKLLTGMRERSKALAEESKKQADLEWQAKYDAAKDPQKEKLLREKIQIDRSAAQDATTEIDKQKALTAELEDRVRLAKFLSDLSDKTAAKALEESNKRTELLERKKTAEEELTRARSEVNEKRIDAMSYHGVVSSVRKLGFGHAPASNHNSAQLKAAQAAATHLAKIEKDIATLNAKIGGTA